MKSIALIAALASCGAAKQHPVATTVVLNSALVVGSGVCALDCNGRVERGVSDAVLIGELALSSIAALAAIDFIVSYATEKH